MACQQQRNIRNIISYIQNCEKQTDLIVAGLIGDVKVNYLNSDIKLQDELAVYKAERAAFFTKEGPYITFSFGAKLGQILQYGFGKKSLRTRKREILAMASLRVMEQFKLLYVLDKYIYVMYVHI
ncbi:MAG: hypothetical protein EZS28_017272 [Streblomastix strix]|uniref:Uncharacterized protein n=1 Tax=Streblomastix strix TaxID=222440 RepID=A0A5J4VYB9_9EUKA|nr:MAG: hypothetical protein EZS28_017272 [Streblomastix strix]